MAQTDINNYVSDCFSRRYDYVLRIGMLINNSREPISKLDHHLFIKHT